MNILQEAQRIQAAYHTRRHFLRTCTTGLGGMALSLMGCNSIIDDSANLLPTEKLASNLQHFAPKAKRVIYLHMAGAPSQLELFQYKPKLQRLDGQPCPESLLKGKTFAFIRGIPKMLGPQATFKQYGESGTWVSERLPHFSSVVDGGLFFTRSPYGMNLIMGLRNYYFILEVHDWDDQVWGLG